MANQVRIEYDPYLQKASYQTRASSAREFGAIPKSDLANPDNRRYHDGALDEILKYAIPELQAKRLAKELIFCGTEDDFQDFQDALARFYERMPDTTWNMTLVRDETADYRAADVVKEEINAIFQGIVDTLTEQQNEKVYQEVAKKLASYSDAVSDKIPVCVVGVYSAGKSAFLNAIIGREILPSHDGETTAKITKIVRSHATCIRFAFKGAVVCLRPNVDKTLENSEYPPELTAFLEQLGEIDRTLPEDQRVYQMMEQLNELAFDAVPMITVETPFRKSSLPEEIPFVFYDTPGAKTADNPAHEELLKEELCKRTNGLPVFITKMDSISKKDDVDTARSIVENAGAALDKRNALLIINKADMSTPDELEKTAAGWRTIEVSKLPELLKWQHRHVLFTASVVALGYKLRPAKLQSREYRMHFNRTQNAFCNSDDLEFYYSLPQYDLLPKAQMDAALAAVKAAEGSPDELALQNSGIPAVEAAMTRFARRYASYHKCRKATEYLTDAISLTSGALENRQAEQQAAQEQMQSAYDQKYGALKKAIANCFEAYSIKKISTPIAEALKNLISGYNSDFESRAKESVLKCCREARKEKHKRALDGRIQEATRKLSEECSETYSRILKSLYSEKDAELRSALVRAIEADAATSKEEKRFLQDIVMQAPSISPPKSFSIDENGLIKGHRFLGWNWDTVNEKACLKAAGTWANGTRVEIARMVQDSYQEQYKSCCAALEKRLDNPRNLERWNPKLAALAQQIGEAESAIRQLRGKQEELRQKKHEVEALMKKQEV